jgi:Fe-S-cluster-containing hydrogenase component 2
MEMCMALNSAAGVIVRNGLGRRLETAEALELLAEAQEHGLVQFAENVRRRVNFICNCCSCCCEPLAAARRFAHLDPIHTTRFLPVVDETLCNACGRCASACPVASITVGDRGSERRRHTRRGRDGRRLLGDRRRSDGVDTRPADRRRSDGVDTRPADRRRAFVDETTCLGCGLCVGVCTQGAISLGERRERIVTPLDSAHRCVLQAIERGKLQNLIFSEQARASHRAMATILGVIFRLPPAKQALASEQVKSRYLEAFLSRKQMWP